LTYYYAKSNKTSYFIQLKISYFFRGKHDSDTTLKDRLKSVKNNWN